MTTQRDVLRIELFGGFSLTHDGEQLPPLASRHARLLFAWLALERGRPQPRPVLCDRLWPDVPESRARRRLSHALWQIQDAFGEGLRRPYLLTPGDHVQFDASAPYWLDVEEFEERLDEVDRDGADDPTAIRHLRRCLELYKGDLLAGSYEEWVLREQDRLRQRQVTALVRLVDACKNRGNFDEALVVARRLTHQEPLREESHREVMKLCMLTGQPDLAIEQYERCRSVLDEELGTVPSATTDELYDRVLQRRDTDTTRRAPIDELASERLVARDDERTQLVDQLERTLLGHAGTVLLEGEPGVGKTQLLAHAAEDARWRGFTVLWGTAGEIDVPYAALRQAIAAELDPIRVAQLRAQLSPVWLEEAGRLLPGLAGPRAAATTAPMEGGDAAERMRQALVEVLVGLAAIDPVVLVLEDVHLADAETMEVLRTLARHPEPGRLLALLSYRDVDAREDAAVWSRLRDLDRDARPVRLRLEPLNPFETGALLREVLSASSLPAGFVESVHREAGGNPLYALELLRSLRDTGALAGGIDQLDAVGVPVSDGLRGLIRSRVELLGWEALTVAEFAAVLDVHTDLDTLEGGVGLGPRQLSTAIGELARRNLVRPEAGGWRFTHAATRQVLLDDLPTERATQLHTAAADGLERTRPDEVEAIAHHLTRAGLPRRALPYLRRAADRAIELHAYATAARHLDAAVDAIDSVPSTIEDRCALLLRAEEVNHVLGRRDRQAVLLELLEELTTADATLATTVAIRRARHLGHVDELDAAVRVARSAVAEAPDARLRGRARTSLGEVRHWQGHHEEAVGLLDTAVTELGDDPEALHAMYALATALRALQRFDQAREILEDALALADATDDDVAEVRALGGLADLDAETGASDRAVDRYDRAIQLARTVGFRHREGVGLVNLATLRLGLAQPAAALRSYDEAEAVFRSLGNRRGIAFVQFNRAWLRHRWLGADDDAERDALAALEFFAEVGSPAVAVSAHETLAAIARRHGEVDVALDHLEAGVRLAEEVGDQRGHVQLQRGLAEVHLAAGDPAAAAAAAASGATTADELGMREHTADLAALAAEASLRNGDSRAAVRWSRMAEADVGWSGEPHRVHHRLAVVATTTGAPATAADHHRAAATLLDQSLAGLEEPVRALARAVPAHAEIIALAAEYLPRSIDLRLARADAPLGRPLERHETIQVGVTLGPPPSGIEERRAHLLTVLQQVEDQHAAATIDDLSLLFDVSASTIRRDLSALRRAGHDVQTRGREAG